MELEEFLKTYLGIDKVEKREDGRVILSLLAKDRKREQYIDAVLVPGNHVANIAQIDRAYDARLELWADWAHEDMEQIEAEMVTMEAQQEYRDVD